MNRVNATTDVSPENYHDTVYQVADGEQVKPKYVKAVKIYGDDDPEAQEAGTAGMVTATVLVDHTDPTTVGTRLVFLPGDLTVPDIYPVHRKDPDTWMKSYETPLPQVCEKAWAMVEQNLLCGEATAASPVRFDLEQDANKVLNAVRVMLSGYFGPFLMLLLLGWIKKKMFARIHQMNPPHPVSVDSKLSDIRAHGLKGVFDTRNYGNYNRYYTGASTDELLSEKAMDALSRVFPHRPVALVSIAPVGGGIVHQAIYRHDIMSDAVAFHDGKISVGGVASLAVSYNEDTLPADAEARAVVEFCADKSKYKIILTVKEGRAEISDVECLQAGSLSPHGMIQTRKTLKDSLLSEFVSSLKEHGIYVHSHHTKSVILPFAVAKALVAALSTHKDLPYSLQTNSANDTGVEIMVLQPAENAMRLVGYISDRSVCPKNEAVSVINPEHKFSGLDVQQIMKGQEPVVVLGTNPLQSFASAERRDELLGTFIRDVVETPRRIIYSSILYGVGNILITPAMSGSIEIDCQIPVSSGFSPAHLENFRVTGANTYVSRNPSSIKLRAILSNQSRDSALAVKYSFAAGDADTAIELLYTVLDQSVAKKEK